MYHKGEIAGQRGVGFLVKIKLKNQIIGFEGISDRIALLHLNLLQQPKKWTVIQVYSPIEQATKSEILDFYEQLREIVENYSENNIVLMGDFNALVGARLAGEEHVIGKHGTGKRSKNGEKLVDLLLENNLTLLNSIYRKKNKSKWTWISPDGKTRNEIDYIITNKARSFSDTGVIQNLNFNTNHRMVRSFLNEKSTKKPRPKSILINHLKTSTNDSKDTIEDLMKTVTLDIDLNEKYEKIDNKLKKQTVSLIKKSKKHYLSEKTSKLIDDRKNLIIKKDKKNYLKDISNLSKQIRENMRKDRIDRRNKTL